MLNKVYLPQKLNTLNFKYIVPLTCMCAGTKPFLTEDELATYTRTCRGGSLVAQRRVPNSGNFSLPFKLDNQLTGFQSKRLFTRSGTRPKKRQPVVLWSLWGNSHATSEATSHGVAFWLATIFLEHLVTAASLHQPPLSSRRPFFSYPTTTAGSCRSLEWRIGRFGFISTVKPSDNRKSQPPRTKTAIRAFLLDWRQPNSAQLPSRIRHKRVG